MEIHCIDYSDVVVSANEDKEKAKYEAEIAKIMNETEPRIPDESDFRVRNLSQKDFEKAKGTIYSLAERKFLQLLSTSERLDQDAYPSCSADYLRKKNRLNKMEKGADPYTIAQGQMIASSYIKYGFFDYASYALSSSEQEVGNSLRGWWQNPYSTLEDLSALGIHPKDGDFRTDTTINPCLLGYTYTCGLMRGEKDSLKCRAEEARGELGIEFWEGQLRKIPQPRTPTQQKQKSNGYTPNRGSSNYSL